MEWVGVRAGWPALTGVLGHGASGGREGRTHHLQPPESSGSTVGLARESPPQLWVGGTAASPPPQPGVGPQAPRVAQGAERSQWRSARVAEGDPPVHVLGPSQGSRGSPGSDLRKGALRLLPPPGLLGSLLCEAAMGTQGPAPSQSGPPRPPQEAQQVDAGCSSGVGFKSPFPGGGVTALCSGPKPGCRADCPGTRVCPVPGGRPHGPLEVSQRSCRLWSVVGAPCQVPSSRRAGPAPATAGSPLGSCRPFLSARVASTSPNPGGPCALASGLQTLTCRWSASLRVCVDTSVPL